MKTKWILLGTLLVLCGLAKPFTVLADDILNNIGSSYSNNCSDEGD